MKNRFKISIFALVCGVIFTGCGGGGGDKSGLKKNDYLGSFPAIYADNEMAKKALKERENKLTETGDRNKIMKEVAKIEKEDKAREEKFEADKKVEMAKITGKEIPFTCSEAFDQLNCKIASVKFNDRTIIGIDASIVAKNDFVMNYKNKGDYEWIHYRVVAKDGSTIAEYSFFIGLGLDWGKTKSFTQGQSLRSEGGDVKAYWDLSQNPEKWADFAGIEFITAD